jgi:flagellar hook-associated protein 3 FlgL
MRISNPGLQSRILSELAVSQQRLTDAQEQMTSGKRINQPSDDPSGTGRVLTAQTQLAQSAQYQRNIQLASNDLGASESALNNLDTLLQRANELAVQAGNGSLDASARNQIASEVGQLINEAISIGNTEQGGRYIFSGFQTGTQPFTPDVASAPTVVPYVGDSGQINRQVGPGEQLQVNIPGDQVFTGVFSALIAFRDHLQTNDTASLQGDPQAFTGQLDSVLQNLGVIGSKTQRLDMVQSRLQNGDLDLQTQISNLQDADMVSAVTQLQMSSNGFQAALAAAAKVMNFSLVDFLK